MSSNKTMSLTSDLIVKKGEAVPAMSVNKENKILEEDHTHSTPNTNNGTIAVTVRLDPLRYEKLKLYGVHNRLTNQNIIVNALDQYIFNNFK